jgi:hypothetical protein
MVVSREVLQFLHFTKDLWSIAQPMHFFFCPAPPPRKQGKFLLTTLMNSRRKRKKAGRKGGMGGMGVGGYRRFLHEPPARALPPSSYGIVSY